MEDDSNKCLLGGACPGYYKGCFAAANGVSEQTEGDCGNCDSRWSCEEEPTTCHMSERQKENTKMEQHTHRFATKFIYGESVYLIGQTPVSKQCPMCNGTKLYEGERCPACHATGTILMERKEWAVMADPLVIDHFRVSINAHGVSSARYHGHVGLKSVNRAEENLFETAEAAQAECNRRNLMRVEVALSDIKVSSCFAGTIPAADKLARRVSEYKKTGKFATEIFVDKEMKLWDGYTTYMICRMLDIKTIKVVVKECVCEAKPVAQDEDDGR